MHMRTVITYKVSTIYIHNTTGIEVVLFWFCTYQVYAICKGKVQYVGTAYNRYNSVQSFLFARYEHWVIYTVQYSRKGTCM